MMLIRGKGVALRSPIATGISHDIAGGAHGATWYPAPRVRLVFDV